MDKSTGRYLKLGGKVSAVATELVLCVLIGTGIGWWLDKKFDTSPWLVLLFLFFGCLAGFRAVWKLAKGFNLEDVDKEDDQNKGEGR